MPPAMAASGNLTLLIADLQALSSETKRKHADVKEASDKALALVKSSPDQVLAALRLDSPPPTSQAEDVLKPIFAGCATKNAKVVAIALGSLQRLMGMEAVPKSKLPQVVATLSAVMPLGVEIQLRILQTLPALLTRFPLQLHDGLLAEALLLCFRLQDSRIGVVSSTAAATLRQLVMVVFEGVTEEDKAVEAAAQRGEEPPPSRRPTDFAVSVPPADGQPASADAAVVLRPSARDAYLLFEDLCLLVNGEPGGFLKLQSLPRTFGLELIESVMTGHGHLFQQHPELIFVLRAQLCPLLIRALSERPSFALTLRLMRVAFLLLKQFSDDLLAETEVFLTLLIRMISSDSSPSASSSSSADDPPWLRVLSLEIFRGLCTDFELLIKVYDRYDAKASKEQGGDRTASVFTHMMGAFNRLASEKPHLLGTNPAIIYGSASPSAVGPGVGVQGMIDGVVGMATSAAAPLVAAAASQGSGSLTIANAAMKLQCIDQLDKAEAPPIPEGYVYLLALQCLTHVAEGFAAFSLARYDSLVAASPPRAGGHDGITYAPGAIDLDSLAPGPARAALESTTRMADASWPALLASLSFFLSANLDDELFADALSAMQSFADVCGVLSLTTPRDAFLLSLCRLAVPPTVVASVVSLESAPTGGKAAASTSVLGVEVPVLGGPAAPAAVTLSARSYACLKAVLVAAQFLAGSLGEAWYIVLETLQNADVVMRASRSKKRSTSAQVAGAGPAGGVPSGGGGSAVPGDSDEATVTAAVQRLFESSRVLDDRAFLSFLAALCRLSGEMVGVQPDNAAGGEEALSPSVETPKSLSPEATRPRRSATTGSKALRPVDRSYAVAKLGLVALLNIGRLTQSEPRLGWDVIVEHLLTVARFAEAPHNIRLHAVDVLGRTLVAATKSPASADDGARKRVQTQVVEALAKQSEGEMRAQSSTDTEVRRQAFETLFKILESDGHAFVAGWRPILEILRGACPSPLGNAGDPARLAAPGEERSTAPASHPAPSAPSAKAPVLVRTAFPSLQLICTDFLSALDLEELRHCISVLAEFGWQVDDINIALTAGGLLWQVSDHVQTKKATGSEKGYVELWMYLLSKLLGLCRASRQEVRDGAIQTLFRTIGLYAGTLEKPEWDSLLWDVVFPLLDALDAAIAAAARTDVPPMSVDAVPVDMARQPNGVAISLSAKQLDDSKVLAIESTGRVFTEFIASHISKTTRFFESWDAFVRHLQQAFTKDRPQVGTSSMKTFRQVLEADTSGIEDDALSHIWEIAWKAFGEMGAAVAEAEARQSKDRYFSQTCLDAFVNVAQPLQVRGRLDWDLDRIQRLLAISRAVITYSGSPDYRPDVDALSPLQASVLSAFDNLSLEVPGVASALMLTCSDLAALAFTSPFVVPAPAGSRSPPQHVTHVALFKSLVPRLGELFMRCRSDRRIYEEGSVTAMLSCLAAPMSKKYACPASYRHGPAQPLWKLATSTFLDINKACLSDMPGLGLSDPVYVRVWDAVAEAFRGALLADCTPALHLGLDEQRAEEEFDFGLIAALELDVLPYLGCEIIPDSTISIIGDALVMASCLYELDLPVLHSPHSSSSDDEPSPKKETRFLPSHQFFTHPTAAISGTTADITGTMRERFAYWCLDLLFLMCRERGKDHIPDVSGALRIAALRIPALLRRCSRSMEAYVADAALRGKIPSPRLREEELQHILRKLAGLRLFEGSLWAAMSDNPSKNAQAQPAVDTSLSRPAVVADSLRRSSRAHLAHLYPQLLQLLAVPCPTASARIHPVPYRDFPSVPNVVLADEETSRIVSSQVHDGDRRSVQVLTLECLSLVGEEAGLVAAAPGAGSG